MKEFLDFGFHVGIVFVIAEILRRIFLALVEYFFFKYYYESDNIISSVLDRAFYCEKPTIGFMVILVFGSLLRFGFTKDLIPDSKCFVIVPIFFLFLICKCQTSKLNYVHWLRGDHNLDYAKGMASNYFFGYLFLILPSHGNSFGIKERIDSYEVQQNVTFALDRLIVLVSTGLYAEGTFKSEILKKAGAMEKLELARGGIKRPYKNDVYRFEKKMGPYNMNYYVSVEAATPLLSYYEALNNNPNATWQMKETTREVVIEFYRYLKKLCSDRPEVQDEVEIIFYDPMKKDGTRQDVGYFLKSYIENLHETKGLKWRTGDRLS